MTLEIVWRNPLPLANSASRVERVRSHDCGAVYAVRNPELTEEFELIRGGYKPMTARKIMVKARAGN
jgi:hypothetical protein